ncbi:MAG: hypothetical protein EZS28_017102, partial [Streblomastix strix]
FINITGELEFEECEGPSGSGFFILLENHAVAEINKALFKNCIAWEYGGGFAALIRDESQLIFKGVAQFIQCSCISEIYIPVGGGGIYSDINNGVLNIQDSIFDTCNCSQPGTGGAVSIIQGVNGKVFIKNASFTNCKTLLNSTNSLFGWGGALFLFTSVSSNALSSSNLLMTDLSFGGCESVIAGHNIHIRSVDTKATVLVISQNSLLTVNGIDDLYISPDYEVDYMGIDESNLNEGNNIPYNHLPLFASNAPIEAVKDYYIDADSSDTRYRNIQLSGGAIYAVINGGSMQLNEIVMNQCKSESGGAVFANISNQGKLILNSQCQFYQCESYGNGGGIYVQMDFTTQSQFVINGAIFKQCRSFSSKISSNLKSGYGGGIFLTGTGDFNQQSELLDLRGMKIYQNSALNNGQSVFVVMANVVEWCQQGILGEYVKGNYSDLNSDVNELEGIAVSAETFESLTIDQIKQQQRSLEFHWTQQAIINSVKIVVNISKEQNPLQFTIQGDSMNETQIKFALKDFSWFDNRKKIYGILVSNTGKFFTDLDGQEDEAVQIEIQIEEGEQFYNFKTSYDQDSNSKFVFTWWIILLIALGGLILLIIIIIICCCICNRSKKKKEHIIYPVSEEKIRPN